MKLDVIIAVVYRLANIRRVVFLQLHLATDFLTILELLTQVIMTVR